MLFENPKEFDRHLASILDVDPASYAADVYYSEKRSKFNSLIFHRGHPAIVVGDFVKKDGDSFQYTILGLADLGNAPKGRLGYTVEGMNVIYNDGSKFPIKPLDSSYLSRMKDNEGAKLAAQIEALCFKLATLDENLAKKVLADCQANLAKNSTPVATPEPSSPAKTPKADSKAA